METPLWRAGATERCASNPHDYYPHRAAFRNGSHQPPGRSLFLSCRANSLSGAAPRCGQMAYTDDSEKEIGENITRLTFTKKAAGEMKGRVVKANGERDKAVRLATFHSFCETLLAEADPQRVMLDQFDHWILLRRNLRRLRLDKYRRLADPGQFLNDFVEFFSRCQDELVSGEDYQHYAAGLAAHLEAERGTLDEDTLSERLETVALQQELARAYRASEELLREKNRVSFGSLVTGAVALLERDAPLREAQQNKYRYILVDEFQDTNIAQLRLLEMLAGPTKSVVAVGDNDQAIYRFRGASFGSFKLFLERFAGWKEGQDSTPFRVALTENYRSTPNILRVAMQVIGQNAVSADFPKKVLSPNKPPGEKIRIVELATPEEESRWVASELERIHGTGRRWKDFAVLYRQHAHRDHLVEELSRRKIPFVITRLSILEHPLVRDVLAYLRLIAAPYDDIACARVLAAPAWHLEAADLVRLATRARKEKKAIYDLLQLPQGQFAFDRSQAALGQLVEFVSSQRKTLKRCTAREILGSLTKWLEIPQRAKEHDRKYVTRLAEFMKEWEPKSETRGLAEFIEYLDYYAQAGGVVSLEDDAPTDAVQLMTVHGAKGLEFPQVFLLRVNNRAFPATERSRVFEFPVELMKEGAPAEQFHIQEERRLFYVALNRAEAASRGKRGSGAARRLARCTALSRRGGTGKDFFADCGLGGRVSPTVTGAADAQPVRAERLPDLPATISVRVFVVVAGRSEGGGDFWGRDAHDHQTFCGSIAQGSEAALRRSAKNI